MKRALFVSLLLAAAPAFAQEGITIFDLALGKPLDRPIPGCSAEGRDRGDYCNPFSDGFSRSRSLMLRRPHVNDTTKKIPTWVTQETIHLRLDDKGAVQSITLTTVGPGRQAAVIDSLVGRFGEPSSRATREAQNAMGTKWQVTRAVWDLPEVYIYHDCSKINECYLRLLTPAAQAKEMEEFRQRKEKDKL